MQDDSRPPAKLTCRAVGEAAAYTYVVTDLLALDAR